MGQLVYPLIQVDGNTILEGATFDVSIHHQMAEHSQFTINCPSEALEGKAGFLGEKSKKYIGSVILIQFFEGEETENVSKPSNLFSGIITNITINKYDASTGNILISGYSPTIFLENGKDCKSYEEKNLEDIINETIKDYPKDKLKSDIKPVFKKKLLYTVQYKETDFEFIRRLVSRYGEWIFYNGEQIVVGKSGTKKVDLQYGKDLQQLSFSMQAKPQDHAYIAYDFVKAEFHSISQKDFKESTGNPYINDVAVSSDKIFTKKPHSVFNYLLMEKEGKSQLEKAVKKNQQETLNVIQLSGVSDEASLNVGVKIKIAGENAYNIDQEDDYGSYIITDIFHECNSMGDYDNRFTAVPADTKIPMYYNADNVPISEKQSAIVTDNADPKGLGRVRVQFAWQKQSGEKAPWIRVLTPHAGANKGFYFIPEVDEEVLVDFESGNAEKPFVAGSHYNGSADAKSFKNDQNDIKVIQTRSGHILKFDDKEGAESVTITDKNDNVIKLDTSGKTITISSPVAMNLHSGVITLSAGAINLIAAGSISAQAAANYSLSASNKNESIKNNINIQATNMTQRIKEKLMFGANEITTAAKKKLINQSNENMTISAKDKIDQRGGKLNIQSKKGNIVIHSKGTAELSGKTTKIE